jgi:hypothetical protein
MKNHHKALLALKNLRGDLLFILLFSTAFIFLFDFWFINIPELFKGANTLGNIFYKICLAYLTAYIFYFLNVYVKSQQDLNEVNYFIGRQVASIIGENASIIIEFRNNDFVKRTDIYPSEEELKDILKSIKINDGPYKSISDYKTTWLTYFDFYKKRTRKNIEKILYKNNYLDSKLVSILSELDDSEFFMHLDNKVLFENSDGDLSFMASSLSKYFETLQKLNVYYYEKLFHYLKYSVTDKKQKKIRVR